MKMRLVLPYGLIAEVLLDDTDRSAHSPPRVESADHVDDCPCEACVIVRQMAVQRILQP